MLRALFLALDHHAGRQVGDAHGRVGLVDVLAASTGGAVSVDAQVGRVDLDGRLLVRLGQHGHGAGRGVNAALGLGFRHTLHAVGAGLELELGVDIVALDAGDHFLEAAVLTGVFREDLDPPTLALGIARIHAEQVAGKDRRLVAAGAGTDFEEHVAPILRIFRQQHALQAAFQLLQLHAGTGDFLFSHLAQIRIAVLEQRLGAFEVTLHLAEVAVGEDHRLDFGVFLGIGAKLALIADHFAIAKQRGEFLVAILEDVQLVQQ